MENPIKQGPRIHKLVRRAVVEKLPDSTEEAPRLRAMKRDRGK